MLVDEKGGMIDGDKVMAVCGLDMKRKGKLTGNTIVATVMSNLGLHEFCRNNGIDLVCTQIAEDKLYKKELAREKRREKRRQEAAEAAEAEAAEPEASLV